MPFASRDETPPRRHRSRIIHPPEPFVTAAPDGLPPLAALETARLDWQRDASGEAAPHSAAFDDVYFSRHDGRAETEHVFLDRKSTRLNSSHVRISYAVFCLK